MSLAAGTKLGPYEILAPIGAGGMGEVWRARDPRLNRVVAIKLFTGQHSAVPAGSARDCGAESPACLPDLRYRPRLPGHGAQTRALVQAVKRNVERFPEDFMFR